MRDGRERKGERERGREGERERGRPRERERKTPFKEGDTSLQLPFRALLGSITLGVAPPLGVEFGGPIFCPAKNVPLHLISGKVNTSLTHYRGKEF